MGTVRYTWEDMELFSRASHDHSRLHMSKEYARQTSYGRPIVFGILGAFAALGALNDRRGWWLTSARLDYRRPFDLDTNYRLEAKEPGPERGSVALKDAEGVILSATFSFDEARDPGGCFQAGDGIAPLREQRTWESDELKPGVRVGGRYAPPRDAFETLVARWGLAAKGVQAPQIAVFLWSSFLTGMHLPGLHGTSAGFRVTFDPGTSGGAVPFDYDTTIQGFDDRFRLLTTTTILSGRGGPFAAAEVVAHVRDPRG